MKGFLRRLRGVIGTGLTWAVGFVALGMGYAVLHGNPIRSPLSGDDVAAGFILGSTFAVILIFAERHRRLEDLSLPRIGLWGALAALLLTGGLELAVPGAMDWETVLFLSVFSGGLSSGSLALARRAEPKLLEGDDEPLPAIEGE